MKLRKPIYNPTALPLKSQNPDMFRECCWHLGKRGGVGKHLRRKNVVYFGIFVCFGFLFFLMRFCLNFQALVHTLH